MLVKCSNCWLPIGLSQKVYGCQHLKRLCARARGKINFAGKIQRGGLHECRLQINFVLNLLLVIWSSRYLLLGAGRKLHLDLIIQCHISMSQKMSEDDAFEIDTARKGEAEKVRSKLAWMSASSLGRTGRSLSKFCIWCLLWCCKVRGHGLA